MPLEVLILTGQSGSGKSTAVRALEDQGFFCVDNIPPPLVEQLLQTIAERQSNNRVAVIMDVREGSFLDEAPSLVSRLRERLDSLRLLYLEAREETLLRRYSETRRGHPLDQGQGLRASIIEEREILGPLRELADETIDTSGLTPHELRARVAKKIAHKKPGDDLGIAIISFGFKYGIPLDSDMVLDVRFLPNPYFDPELRHLTGNDEVVRQYVFEGEGSTYLDKTYDYLDFLIPHFKREGKRYLTVAVGCTGGQHRSVSVAHKLSERLRASGTPVDLRHRDAATNQKAIANKPAPAKDGL